MAKSYIIDGYNVIEYVKEYFSFEDPFYERESLIEDLRILKRNTGYRLTLVFDAEYSNNFSMESFTESGIKIVFTKRGTKADDHIVKMIKKEPAGKIVVTNDRELKMKCEMFGSKTMSTMDFVEKLFFGSENEDPLREEDRYENGVTTKKKGPSRKKGKSRKRR